MAARRWALSLCMFLEGCNFKSREALGLTRTFSPLEGVRRRIKLRMERGYGDKQIPTPRTLGIELPAGA